jgi:hypothetical protein
MLKIPAEYDRNVSSAKFLPASLLGVSTGICQIALVGDSGMIRIQMGMQERSDNGRSAWDALYDTTQ